MQPRFKYLLHCEVLKAVIKTIKARKPNEYDNEPTYKILKEYFESALGGMKATCSFCLCDAELIKEFEDELQKAKGV